MPLLCPLCALVVPCSGCKGLSIIRIGVPLLCPYCALGEPLDCLETVAEAVPLLDVYNGKRPRALDGDDAFVLEVGKRRAEFLVGDAEAVGETSCGYVDVSVG